MPLTIFTVGHSTHSLDQFLALLAQHQAGRLSQQQHGRRV
jgi:hypothetical protein